MKVRVFALVLASVLLAGVAGAADEGTVRAHWVSAASLQSPEAIRRMVATAQVNGFNTLFIPVQPARGAFDPLAEALAAAHERGLRVHAWLHVNLVSGADELPAARENVVYQNPGWLMVPRELAPELLPIDVRSPEYLGRLTRWTRANAARVDGLYVSPLHDGVQALLAASVQALFSRYAFDGLHLDAVRFPGSDFDYSRAAIDVFRASMRDRLTAGERARLAAVEAIDPFAYPEELADEWRLFRQTRLTALVTRLRSTAKALRPGATVSAAVTADAERAARDTFQDWRTWLDNGFIDALCPLPDGAPSFAAFIADLQALAGSRPVWVRD